MIILVSGAPGAGKGTQADLLVEQLGLEKLSTGDALRRQISLGTKLGNDVSDIMKEGKLVPDELLLDVLKAELPKLGSNILLDGYPRNLNQAKTLDRLGSGNRLGLFLHLDVNYDLLLSRIVGRRVCPSCQGSYHLDLDMPSDNRCRKCGEELVQRDDDTEDRVRTRLKVYNEQTVPVIDFYKEKGIYRLINGEGSVLEVFGRIKAVLKEVLG